MRYSVTVKTAPVAEPLTLVEAKRHLRIDDDITVDDDQVDGLIAAAREWAENETRRSFVRRTLELRLDCFSAELKLPRGPVTSVVAVKYVNNAGSLVEVDASLYQVDIYGTPPTIRTVFGANWPVPKMGTVNAVVVEYLAGYAPGDGSPTDYAENVPSNLKSALKLHIEAHYDRDRMQMEQLLKAARNLLSPFVIRDFALE